MKITRIIAITGLTVLLSGKAIAMIMCPPEPCKAALVTSSAVIFGKAISTEKTTDAMREEYKSKSGATNAWDKLPDEFTNFQVTTVYKGPKQETIRLFHFSETAAPGKMISSYISPPQYPDGASQLIFAQNKNGFLFAVYGPCHQCTVDSPVLKEVKATYDSLNALIKQYPLTASFYGKLADLYEQNNDYSNAVATYESFFSTAPAARENKPFVISYGRNLFFAGRYQDAVKALEPVQMEKEALSYIQQSKLHLGGDNSIAGEKLEMAGKELTGVVIQDKDLAGSDFSGATLTNVKFVNVKMSGSDFSGAKMQKVTFDHCDLSAARFDNAKVDWSSIIDSNLDKATFTKAAINLVESSRNSFKDADFTDGGLHVAEGTMIPAGAEGSDYSHAKFLRTNIGGIGGSKTAGADFTGASFYSGRTPASHNQGLDLSGQNFDNGKLDSSDFTGGSFKGASLKNVTFTGSNLTNVDFSGADLTGADFSVSSYSGVTKLHGANFSGAKIGGIRWAAADYDCKTKFPEGFSPVENMMAPKADCPGPSTSAPVNFSWEKMLEPPFKHYRLMAEQGVLQFRDADFSKANFEGIRLGEYFNVTLKDANLRYTTGGLDIGDGGTLDGADLSYAKLGYGHWGHKTKPTAKNAKLFCTNMVNILHEVDFSEADWTGAIMNSLNVARWPSDFTVNPVKQKMIFINMEDVIAKFGPADFSGMDFSGCDFNYINFSTANLSNTKFRGTYLYATNFSDANLSGANFDGARVMYNTKFPPNFDVNKFKIIATQTQNADSSPFAASELRRHSRSTAFMDTPPKGFTVHNYPGEDFSKLYYPASWLPGSNMSGAKMRLTNWQASNFTGADLSGVDATGAVFFDALMDNVNFTGATLYGTDFRSTRLLNAKLDGANLKNALYDDTTEWPEGFDPVKAGAYLVVKKARSPY